MNTDFPRRIVCLTEETVETLYLLGEQDRIVGVSGYAVRPPEVRQKPRVCAFTTAKIEKILAVRPDLVFAFSDLQADIVRDLIREGVTVFAFNQRGVGEIFDMMATVSRVVVAEQRGLALTRNLRSELDAIAASAARFPKRPRVFFEEWNQPLISGIRWVEELIEIAGGTPVFPELRREQSARNRIVDPAAVIPTDPEIIIASWCGTKVNKSHIRARDGWSEIAAVRDGHVYEIKSTYILQPGPAALTEGIRQLHFLIARAAGVEVPAALRPAERTDPDIKISETPLPGASSSALDLE